MHISHGNRDRGANVAGRQVRIAEEVVTAASTERVSLGFASDTPIGVVVAELARDGIEYRRTQQRERARAAAYASWAENDELHEDVLQTLQWTIEARTT